MSRAPAGAGGRDGPTHAPAAGAGRRRSSLFWRLLPSYLLVVAVAAVVTLAVGEGFAPYFLRHHVDDMMRAMDLDAMATGMRGMTQDLAAAYRRALTQSLAWAVVAASVAAAVVGLFVSRRIVLPLRAMRRASRSVAGGHYEERLDPRAPGEVGDLADAFNELAEALANSEARRVALLADVAHEFRTPLANLRGYVEGLEDGVFEAGDATALPACRRQIERLERLVDDLSLLSRVETGVLDLRPERIDARTVAQHAAQAFLPAYRQADVRLDLALPADPVWVWADGERSEQALANLLSNALRFTPPGRSVRLTLRAVADLAARPEEGGAAARLEVRDEGPGVAPGDLPHVFKRFYRGAGPAAQGRGIGLTIARHLVERQGGVLDVDSPPGEGATFWFTLPSADRRLHAASTAPR